MTTNRSVLQGIQLGNSVAEFDESLEAYFVETETFRRLVRDEMDIVAGDKGTGKTALFRILSKRYRSIEGLEDVEVLPAFNLEGSPVFQRLTEGEALVEGQYQTLWKGYFLSLVGNWLLKIYEEAPTDRMHELSDMLKRTGLLSADDSPSTVFSSIVNLFRRISNPRIAEIAVTIDPSGLPIVLPRVEFRDPDAGEAELVPHNEAFSVLNQALNEIGLTVWLAMDRLDEAFAGMPAAEVPALRALLRTYLDLLPYDRVRLKLFLRRDLFRRIIAGGFVNLTHVNARKVEITWDEESLHHLLYRRLREGKGFLGKAGVEAEEPDQVFDALFPPQVDPGERKPTTWNWMMSRIRDGNDVKPPRNLIDLGQKAVEAAIRREEREATEFRVGQSVLRGEDLKGALVALSKQRVEDTLLAEAGEQAVLVERLRGGKAEHNEKSLRESLGLAGEELDEAIDFLIEVGCLEKVGGNYKVPMLYRDGLTITQGRAF